MKVTFGLSVEPRVYPFNYYEQLARSFYDRAPCYQHHDGLSLHSIGWIRGHADATRRGLVFSTSSTWSLGVVHKDALTEYLASVEEDSEIIPGVHVESVNPVAPSGGRVRYWAESPILIRWDGDHVAYDHDAVDNYLTRSVRSKLRAVGISEDVCDSVSAEFDRDYDKARTKVVQVGQAEYRANVCPIYLEAEEPLLHELVMSTGVGGLTGMGLGAILPASTQ